MEKNHYFYKLIAPRPTFHLDMTPEEKMVMEEHILYWQELSQKGISIVYGPVFDPEGVYGMAVIETEGNVDEITQNDPAIKSGICTCAVYPMKIGMTRK